MPEAGAAAVAAQLLAFAREPVRHRPRLTHGREVLAGGLLVFRFAQGRFPHAIVRDYPPAERERLREAAVSFIRQVCLWEGATHYQLLCLAPGARREMVKEHYHALIALLHPDRAEPAATSWPASAAQRVNAAYAVLSSEERRREYDASLRKAPAAPAAHGDGTAPVPRSARSRTFSQRRWRVAVLRHRRPALAVALTAAALFFASVEFTAFQGAKPFDASVRWAEEAWSGAGPRFLRMSQATPAPAEASGLPEAAPPSRPGTPSPAAEGPRPPPRLAVSAIAAGGTAGATTPLLAQAPPIAPAAEAMPAAPAGAASLGTPQMETLVALLVTCYETGDLERLLALQDPRGAGTEGRERLRRDFETFFRATRERRLRLHNVSLEPAGSTGRARGEATLSAEHEDGRPFQRAVKLDLELVARDGAARISRLALYPHGD